jgi:hypothetical protein
LYIKDLEAKVNDLKASKDTIKKLQQENAELRDYILALQSRWINQPGGIPTPPAVYVRRGGAPETSDLGFDEKSGLDKRS